MIKSFHKLLVPRREKDYAALVKFFEALGLRRGESWDGRRSTGVKFDAREAGVEIGTGEGFPDADLVIEVDSADAVYEAITSPSSAKRGRKGGPPIKIADEIADADWGARIFTLEMPAGAGRLCIFFYKEDWRAKKTGGGKLGANGVRFAIAGCRSKVVISRTRPGGAQGARERLSADVAVPGAGAASS